MWFRSTLWTPAIVTLGLTAACVEPDTPRPPAPSAPAIVRIGTRAGVVSVPLEEYVLGSALAEVSPVGLPADTVAKIFDVQAILARTYALAHLGRHRQSGFDLCDTTHCQLYEPARIDTSRFAGVARQAVDRTRGLILQYAGRPADALFHSDCGGHTAAADDVWGGAPVAYLAGTPDEVPALSHRAWRFETSVARLGAALHANDKSDVGRRLDSLTIVSRDSSGRAARIEARGERVVTLRGEDLRAALNRAFGDRSIQSTRFTVRRVASTYQFAGTGFGHGVGLCQVGAAARARLGQPAGQILAAYFPGASVAETGRLAVGLPGLLLERPPTALLRSP